MSIQRFSSHAHFNTNWRYAYLFLKFMITESYKEMKYSNMPYSPVKSGIVESLVFRSEILTICECPDGIDFCTAPWSYY